VDSVEGRIREDLFDEYRCNTFSEATGAAKKLFFWIMLDLVCLCDKPWKTAVRSATADNMQELRTAHDNLLLEQEVWVIHVLMMKGNLWLQENKSASEESSSSTSGSDGGEGRLVSGRRRGSTEPRELGSWSSMTKYKLLLEDLQSKKNANTSWGEHLSLECIKRATQRQLDGESNSRPSRGPARARQILEMPI
jgi:hypothetical protein